jgi:hypothetical protein
MKVNKLNFSKSQERFNCQTKEQRDQCMWQIIPIGFRFRLECWKMKDGTLAIFQIFSDGAGYIKYVQEL